MERSDPNTMYPFKLCHSIIAGSALLLVLVHLLGIDTPICFAAETQNPDGSITLSASITAGADDAVERIITGYNQLKYRFVYPGKNIIIGYRFNGIDIPPDAIILYATLMQYSSGYEDRTVHLKYIGQASAEPALFTGKAHDLSLRNRTRNHVIDSPTPWPRFDFFSSPDLAPVIQEIIEDPQWLQGGTLVLFVEDEDSISSRKIDHFEYDPLYAARIQITYMPAESESIDTLPPEINILMPEPDFQTDQPTIILSGTASDDSSVERIDWQLNTGDSGSIPGAPSWSIPDVTIHEGENTITVQAFDPAGNTGEETITVYRIPATPSEQGPITVTVAEGSDDSFEKTYNSTNNAASKGILIGKGYLAGFRFPDVRIPAGSGITHATLLLHCYAGESRDINVRYRGEAAAVSAPFASATGDISGRDQTRAEISERAPAWSLDTANASPDLKEIVQEIIDQPGWQSGNALSLFLEDIDSNKYRNVRAFENDPARAAVLKIEYVPFLGSRVAVSALPTQIEVGESVEFHAEFSEPDKVLDWLWRFGDGETSAELNIVHKFTTAGIYKVRFEFTDIYNNQFSESVDVMVAADTSILVFEGFGESTTGGEGFPTLIAGSPAEFAAILSRVKIDGGNAVILLEGDWTYTANVSLARLSNLTIDGMDASVTFDGSSLNLIDCDNIILRGLRVRKHQTGGDGIQVNSCRKVVIDHCSLSEAGDGNLDITGYSYGPSSNITVSWSILANTWKQSLVKYNGTTNITFHHNLFYNGGGRFPSLHEGIFDIRNNVMWQWESYGLVLISGARANIVNNIFTIADTSTRGHAAIWYLDEISEAWLSGNILPPAEKDVSRLSGPLDVPAVTTQSAQEAKALVLNQAGAMPRDGYDQETVQMIRDNLFPPYPPHHD